MLPLSTMQLTLISGLMACRESASRSQLASVPNAPAENPLSTTCAVEMTV